jgi:hypothetical protein
MPCLPEMRLRMIVWFRWKSLKRTAASARCWKEKKATTSQMMTTTMTTTTTATTLL